MGGQMIYIPKLFTLAELLHTDCEVPNVPTFEAVHNLSVLAQNILDPIRAFHWKRVIHVNSGYRSKQVNDFIKGAQNSQHMTGQAADITAGSKDLNKQLFEVIVKSGLKFDQLIDEKGYQWIHISYNHQGNRQQILHL